jgi:hypothetical protein
VAKTCLIYARAAAFKRDAVFGPMPGNQMFGCG